MPASPVGILPASVIKIWAVFRGGQWNFFLPSALNREGKQFWLYQPIPGGLLHPLLAPPLVSTHELPFALFPGRGETPSLPA